MAEGGRGEEDGKKVAVINLEEKTEVCCFLGKTRKKKQEEGPLSLFLPSVSSPQKKIFFVRVDPSYKKTFFFFSDRKMKEDRMVSEIH